MSNTICITVEKNVAIDELQLKDIKINVQYLFDGGIVIKNYLPLNLFSSQDRCAQLNLDQKTFKLFIYPLQLILKMSMKK